MTQRTRPPRRGHDVPAPAEPEALVREAGGPEDNETHACQCGYVFEAAVSTTVACPHCGATQAW
jgi:rubrerythrin